MNIKNFLQTSITEKVIKIAVIIIAALAIFALGISIGNNRGRFAQNWSNNYREVFDGPRSPFSMRNKMGGGELFRNSHGAIGEVITIESNTMVIKNPNEPEKMILFSTTTAVHSLRNEAKIENIKVGSKVVVIGNPDDKGRINASLIRIMPEIPLYQNR